MLINKKAVKNLAIEAGKKYSGGRFTRVSKEFFETVDARVKTFVEGHVRQLPSVGKTIK